MVYYSCYYLFYFKINYYIEKITTIDMSRLKTPKRTCAHVLHKKNIQTFGCITLNILVDMTL